MIIVSWFLWAARMVLAVVIATAVYGAFDQGTPFGWVVTFALVAVYGLVTRPVRPLSAGVVGGTPQRCWASRGSCGSRAAGQL